VAVEETPLGYKKPDGNDPARNGDNIIAHNAQRSQDLIADLQTRFPSHFDGGGPDTIYAGEQTIDGGTV
jgi:hypothetical protein